jgi:hypothetical protein
MAHANRWHRIDRPASLARFFASVSQLAAKER